VVMTLRKVIDAANTYDALTRASEVPAPLRTLA